MATAAASADSTDGNRSRTGSPCLGTISCPKAIRIATSQNLSWPHVTSAITADNRYLEKAVAQGYSFDGKTPDDLIARRLIAVQKTRDDYRRFWEENVAPNGKDRGA